MIAAVTRARQLIIVEDDAAFAEALQRSFRRRGYEVQTCDGLSGLEVCLASGSPGYAVVDLKVVGGSGLECVRRLHTHDPEMRIVVLTGFASIATAIEATKLGTCYYLAKPSNADDIEAAFERGEADTSAPISARPTSIKTLEWERIHETLVETGFNISETARRLGMHRRTLARKLEKRRVT
jgi:two-component system response regulator RegA